MKSQCLPFQQIPHTSRLFLDYLAFSPDVQQFYPRSPRFLEWAADEVSRLQYPSQRRQQVANLLERQNRAWSASASALENISKFRAGACAVVTGQQVGLFGGPMFSIYKALSAVKLAEEARKLGVNCVPIFWLATEDHDIAEVNQANLPIGDGHLEHLSSPTHARPDAAVGSVAFGQEISAVVDRAAELLGQTEVTALLSEAYRPGETFGTAFAKLFARVFSELGVILLNGSDPELDSTAAPTYQQAIERASELTRALLGRDEQLRSAGYHQQVRITDSSTLLFMFRDGARLPIHMSAAGGFEIGQGKITPKALLQMCNSTPQVFSPNVLLRPVIQDYVLPTLAYVGGSAEVAYFAQAGAVYSELLGRVTPIVPRFSATIIDPKLNVLLERYNLLLPEVFQGADVLRERIGANLLPPNLQNSFDQATHAVGRSMAAVEASLGQLDKTLVESAQNAASKMLYQITNLRARAARAELRQSEVVGRHAELLSFSLYPEKRLQEREFAGAYFLAKYGRELLQQLLATIHPDCVDHQVLSL